MAAIGPGEDELIESIDFNTHLLPNGMQITFIAWETYYFNSHKLGLN